MAEQSAAEQELAEAEAAYRQVNSEGGHDNELKDARRRLAEAQNAVASGEPPKPAPAKKAAKKST